MREKEPASPPISPSELTSDLVLEMVTAISILIQKMQQKGSFLFTELSLADIRNEDVAGWVITNFKNVEKSDNLAASSDPTNEPLDFSAVASLLKSCFDTDNTLDTFCRKNKLDIKSVTFFIESLRDTHFPSLLIFLTELKVAWGLPSPQVRNLAPVIAEPSTESPKFNNLNPISPSVFLKTIFLNERNFPKFTAGNPLENYSILSCRGEDSDRLTQIDPTTEGKIDIDKTLVVASDDLAKIGPNKTIKIAGYQASLDRPVTLVIVPQKLELSPEIQEKHSKKPDGVENILHKEIMELNGNVYDIYLVLNKEIMELNGNVYDIDLVLIENSNIKRIWWKIRGFFGRK